MNKINLEAEQVVSEEGEEAPAKKRSLLRGKSAAIVFVAVVILEAVVLFFVFGGMQEAAVPPASANEAEGSVSIKDLTERLEKAHKIEVGPIAILDDHATGARADRHYSLTVDVYIEEETYLEIMRVSEVNPHALDLIKSVMEREIRKWMLDVGGEALKDKEMQGERGRKLRDHLNDRLPALRNRITDVFLGEFSVRKH